MFIYVGFGVLLAASCRDVYSLQLQTVGSHPNNVGDYLTDTIVLLFPGADSLDEEPRNEIYDTTSYGYTREKRAASLAAIGLAALKQLLTGAKKIRSRSMRYRSFQKDGDFESAEQDFYSINPRNIKIYSGQAFNRQTARHGGKVLLGTAGDRRLVLRRNGWKNNPTLEIIEYKETPGQYTDRIIYTKSNK